MSNMHRIMWFDSQIKENKYPNRNAVAERFEISIRQAQRDIDYLKDSLKAPLRYDAKNRGYYYEEKSFILPNVFINEEQKRLLSFLTYSYENYNQSPKVKKIIELFKKLSGEENVEEDIPIFDLNKSITENLYCLADSIRKRQKINIRYRDQYKGEIEYKILPYKLFNRNRVDYIYGYFENVNDFITLRIDRIIKIILMEENFDIHSGDINYSGSDIFEKTPFWAKIRFSKEPEFTYNVNLRFIEVEPLIYHIYFYHVEDIVDRLIKIDDWEEIVSPNWLKRKLQEKCNNILEKLN